MYKEREREISIKNYQNIASCIYIYIERER